MRRLILVSVIVLLLPLAGLAQEKGTPSSSQTYVFFAPGWGLPGGGKIAQFGGGGERRVYKRLGIGGDLGYLFPARGVGNGVGLLSVNASYHFGEGRSSQKLVPFVTGGYSLMFRGGAVSGFNFGGGVTEWFTDRIGLRMEVRDHTVSPCGCRLHVVQFRVGLTFR